MKTLTGFLFSKTIGKFFCFLGLYISLIVNSQAAGFVNVSSLSISEIPVTIGQNFYIHFELKEYQNDWKYFEYIEVWIQDKNQKDLYPVKRWDNVSFSPNTRHGFLAITYLYTSRSPGDYFVVVRGKEYGKNPFNFGVVPNNYASCPYKFTAISPGKADVVFSNYGPGNSSLCVENGCTFWPQGIDTPSGPLPKFYGMAFTVPGTSSFKLDSISVTAFDMAYSTDSTMIPATLILSINEDLNGLPGAVLEQFTFSNFNSVINFEVPYSALLTGISTYRPKLSAGTQYWITADVSEPTRMEVGWASNNQGHAGFMVQRTGSEPWASLGYQYQPVLRVMGKPTSGGGGNKDNSHVAFVRVATDIGEPSSMPINTVVHGHAWIEVIMLTSGWESSLITQTKTYGTWPDDSLAPTSGYLQENFELGRLPDASRSLFVNQKQYDDLMKVVNKYKSKGDNAWGLIDNCTAFAKDSWKAVSNEKINPYWVEDIGIPRPTLPNPVALMYSIIELNGDMSERTINKCNSPYCASPCPPPAIFCY